MATSKPVMYFSETIIMAESVQEESGFAQNQAIQPGSPALASSICQRRHGAVSEKPKSSYFGDYMKRMPRQKRRRIQQEIDKGYKPGLTVKNVRMALRGVSWRKVGEMLFIPSSRLNVIAEECNSEEQCEAAVIRYWIIRDPFASWRRIVQRLDRVREHDVADNLRHYTEELNDSTLTRKNVAVILNTVNNIHRLRACLGVPHSVRTLISKHCDTHEQSMDELIGYWLQTSPYALESWTWLTGQLLNWGEESALTAVKRYICRTTDPTLTLSNVTTIMKAVEKWKESAYEINIPYSIRNELLHSAEHHTTDLRKKAFWNYWLKEHPSPTWLLLADALYRLGEHEALELLQKSYLRGSSESRRLFELSMKNGFLDVCVDKMLFYGSAGVGKTSSRNIVTGEDPPTIRNSTPLATRPVTLYEMQATREVWLKYTSKERMKLCAQISKSILGSELIEALRVKVDQAVEMKSSNPEESDLGEHEGETVAGSVPVQADQPAVISVDEAHHDLQVVKSKPLALTPKQADPVDPKVTKVIHDVLNEMFELIDECPDSDEPITYLRKVKIVDSGGQPQFHEVLPIFLRKMSLIIFVIKLSEELSKRPTIEYFQEGEAVGIPYLCDHTTEQLIVEGLRSLHSHRCGRGISADALRIIVFGTHKDEEGKSKESRQTKNEKLREMLLPTFEKEVIYYEPSTNDIIFPMNAKSPGKEEEMIAQVVHSVMKKECRSRPRHIPLQWMVLEIILEEITQKLQRGLLSKKECLEVAYRLQLDESALEAALIYLDELSMIFYYPEILPELVFTDPQVLLDKVSEIVKVHHDIGKSSRPGNEAWQKFFNHALVSTRFLSLDDFNKHYVSNLFGPDDLVRLFQKLFIFANYSEEKFFVPSLLRMLDKKEVSKHRLPVASLIAPLVLHSPDGPPHRGVFCALVCFLASQENHLRGPWKLKMPLRSVTPSCLYRNCIQFTIPGLKTPCTVTLINALLHFEVHVKVSSSQAAAKVCPTIKRCISSGMKKASMTLGYTDIDSLLSFAFLCPCGVGEPHPATIGDGFWICHLDEGEGDEFSPEQLIWLEEDTVQHVQSRADSTPTMPELLSFNTGDCHIINLPREIGCKYHIFGSLLLLEKTAAHIEDLEHQCQRNGEEINLHVLQEWLEGRGRKPTTWATLLNVLRDIEMGELAATLERCLL